MLPQVQSLFAWAITKDTLQRRKSRSSSKELGTSQLVVCDCCSLMPPSSSRLLSLHVRVFGHEMGTAEVGGDVLGQAGCDLVLSSCFCSSNSASCRGQLVHFTTSCGFPPFKSNCGTQVPASIVPQHVYLSILEMPARSYRLHGHRTGSVVRAIPTAFQLCGHKEFQTKPSPVSEHNPRLLMPESLLIWMFPVCPYCKSFQSVRQSCPHP